MFRGDVAGFEHCSSYEMISFASLDIVPKGIVKVLRFQVLMAFFSLLEG